MQLLKLLRRDDQYLFCLQYQTVAINHKLLQGLPVLSIKENECLPAKDLTEHLVLL